MRAVRMTAPGVLEHTEVPTPQAGPGEVLLRVGAVGACHSDLHILDSAGLMPFPLPFTLGHETAGWVEKLGPGAGGVEVGDVVDRAPDAQQLLGAATLARVRSPAWFVIGRSPEPSGS